MSISQKIEKYYKNCIECIKKMKNGTERDLAIGSLVCDLGKGSLKPVAKAIESSFRKVKKCVEIFLNGEKFSLETRGRKKLTDIYPNLKMDIEKVIDKYKNIDPHFKTEQLYISINPTSIIGELVANYGYPPKFACYNSIRTILLEMRYKLKRISKTLVIDRIPETDAIFDNVTDTMESELETGDDTAVISIDDKATKKVGRLSDNGKSWFELEALDHDTNFDYSIKPFGILDLKTHETFITCTLSNSTAKFKVECIENYIIEKNKKHKLKKLVIFLDNGPENSSRRKLWLKSIVSLSIRYDLIIELVYYPPYHSKYNKIEHYWGRLQMNWNKVIVDSLEKLIDCINKTVWHGIKSIGSLSTKEFEKGIIVSDYEIENSINPHIIREEGLEKWSLVITPYAN